MVASVRLDAGPSGTMSIVLGADTAVVVGDEILGKPRDAEDAARMLRRLSGRTHQVMTGVSVARRPRRSVSHVETTSVTVRAADRGSDCLVRRERGRTRQGRRATRFRGSRRGSFRGSKARIRTSSGCRSRSSIGLIRRLSWPPSRPCITASSRAILSCPVCPEVLMTHRYMKIGITVGVLVLAFTGLLWSTLREGTEYYKHVDEVMASPSDWQGKQLQLHGFVVANSILVEARHARIPLQGPEQRQGHGCARTRASCPTPSRTARAKKRKSC